MIVYQASKRQFIHDTFHDDGAFVLLWPSPPLELDTVGPESPQGCNPELATLVGKSGDYLRNKHLIPMVSQAQPRFRYPDSVKRPQQAYVAPVCQTKVAPALIVCQTSKRLFIHDTFHDDIEFVLSQRYLPIASSRWLRDRADSFAEPLALQHDANEWAEQPVRVTPLVGLEVAVFSAKVTTPVGDVAEFSASCSVPPQKNHDLVS